MILSKKIPILCCTVFILLGLVSGCTGNTNSASKQPISSSASTDINAKSSTAQEAPSETTPKPTPEPTPNPTPSRSSFTVISCGVMISDEQSVLGIVNCKTDKDEIFTFITGMGDETASAEGANLFFEDAEHRVTECSGPDSNCKIDVTYNGKEYEVVLQRDTAYFYKEVDGLKYILFDESYFKEKS